MPRRLDAIVGQGSAVSTLSRHISSNRIPHAILLGGPKGVGKRSTAEAFAAQLLCKAADAGGACGRCRSCAQMDLGTHRDFYRVAPNEKDNILVESIREMERALHLRAAEAGRKIAVLTDVHRMGGPAQNAVLKTLEEPPDETHLILVTERPEVLLPTVRSRCQRIDFVPLSVREVESVVANASPDCTPAQRHLLAAMSDGAPGVALSLDFDALMQRRDQVIRLDERIDSVVKKAPLEALEAARDLGKDKLALASLLETWTTWVRDQALLLAGMPDHALCHSDQRDRLRQLAERRGLSDVLERADALLEARRQLDLPFNLNGTMVAEQLLLTLAGQLPLRRIPFRPNTAPVR